MSPAAGEEGIMPPTKAAAMVVEEANQDEETQLDQHPDPTENQEQDPTLIHLQEPAGEEVRAKSPI
tara:strand:- start:250 stop:447 length:198 start_codon:yes stop_codon:yes gene_type:complete